MKKPYIKKYDDVSKFTVWIVDGKYIRENLDIEFTNYGQHFRFPFIPENEFWIDKENVSGEEKYYIDHMLVENKLMAAGKTYAEATERACKIEKRERNRNNATKPTAENTQEIIEKEVHKQLLPEYSQKIKVWIVNGERVRTLFYVDFTQGGHDKVYPFIPAGEIWIDDDLNAVELKFVLLHELHERRLMCRGWPYNSPTKSAHMDSSKLEYFCRNHPEWLDKKLQEELSKIKPVRKV